MAKGYKLRKADHSEWQPSDIVRWGAPVERDEPEGSLQDVFALMGGKVRKKEK